MKPALTLVAALLLPGLSLARAADEVVVYPPVPGLAPSGHYQVRVRPAGQDAAWQSVFAWETACKSQETKTDAYFDTLAGWTHAYVNFETAGAGLIFRNIHIEDSRPTLQQFFLCMTVPPPYSNSARQRDAGDLSGIRFENISIAAPSVLGEPQLLWGQANARIRNLTFENLTVAGVPVRDPAFFRTNDFVDGLVFEVSDQRPTPQQDAP